MTVRSCGLVWRSCGRTQQPVNGRYGSRSSLFVAEEGWAKQLEETGCKGSRSSWYVAVDEADQATC